MNRRALLGRAAALAGGVLLSGASEWVGPADTVARPLIRDRSAWRARPPRLRATVLHRAPDHIVIHHTATANSADVSLRHAYALSRAIQNYHMDHNGWNDTGQQLTVSRGGHIMEGRNRSLLAIGQGKHVMGAQTANHNSHTIGIECEGIYTSADVPDRLLAPVVDLCAWLCSVYGLNPHRAIVGHCDYNATACPGDVFYRRLPELRNGVAKAMGLRTRTRPDQPQRTVPYPGPTEPFNHGPALGPAETG